MSDAWRLREDIYRRVSRERAATRFFPRPLPFDPDWRCPLHDRRVLRTSQRTGMEYPGCDRCHLFARLTLTLAEVDRLTRPRSVDDLPF